VDYNVSSPILILYVFRTGSMKILPSPGLPVLAASMIILAALSASSIEGSTISISTFGLSATCPPSPCGPGTRALCRVAPATP